ncbi:hypothetical protein FXV77_12105 [Sphingobacterium phlebotomi]|uniref:VOC domain-containing protein n=1 Tax=Sphingobacterium phlebotomi TaxID=2605433 RepID=A0A5D4H699_9SPHI|nr:hypothetical protein [Sphingobacterium phlebotomi]TYR35812.1 hypothetical protein FXV77_12105 [Sphingobacterium phlebotomi]
MNFDSEDQTHNQNSPRPFFTTPKKKISTVGKAAIDESYGGYIGYISDPDGHLWELVYPPQQA